ncbi:hypothetical protein [Falsibacillus pallidus]|uniref:Uncharacterized protein n=1 Tax=Falsibacillus pallidus TaxID=493781 RepID=A0A370GLA1_9BACI|nr:hypothetical protein [Falsibacillus pallidus]RDI44059.1 hypothetical protein DFR59_103122 [Falsibacillus pallidus]
MYGRTNIKLFSEKDFFSFSREKEESIKQTIDRENDNYILNTNESDYIAHLLGVYQMNPVTLLTDQIYATEKEELISSDRFPNSFYVTTSKSYPRPVITFHIPYSGDRGFLKIRPSQYIMWSQSVPITENEILFSVIVFSDTAESVEREYQSFLNRIQQQIGYLQKDIDQFNQALEGKIQAVFQKRKEQILSRKNLVGSLSVPIRKSADTPKTFAVPVPKVRQKISAKPIVTENGYKPDPSIDMKVYNEILSVIHDVGVMFERMPSTYSGKGEEDLRDHILMNLEARFEGSATGETFNKRGKTDILLRHENSNVFIGECKFWKGKKGYLDTISQLLDYLTWRDSKAAVIMFVRTKSFSPVLDTVKKETADHPNFLDFVSETNESWINYRFHINGDKNREVKLAVMLYHIPA